MNVMCLNRLPAAAAAALLLSAATAAWGQDDHHQHAGAADPPPPLTVGVGSLQGPPGKDVDVPITVKGASGIGPMEMVLAYDPAVLEAKGENPASAGPLLGNSLLVSQADPSGKMSITWAASDAIKGDGTVAVAHFTVRGRSGQKSALTLQNVRAWGREAPHLDALVTAEAGEFTVVRPWPWLLLGLVAAAVVLALIAWVVWRRRKARPALATVGAAPGSPAMTAAPQAASFCPQCGGPAAAGAAFCPACGHKLAGPAAAARLCPSCGRPVAAGKKFCTFDGTRIE